MAIFSLRRDRGREFPLQQLLLLASLHQTVACRRLCMGCASVGAGPPAPAVRASALRCQAENKRALSPPPSTFSFISPYQRSLHIRGFPRYTMNADIRRYERINPDTELEIIDIQLDDRGYTSGNRLDTTALDSTSYVGNVIRRRNIFKSWKFRNPIRRIRRQGQRDWRFGLFAGLSASIFVLTCNAGILLYGVLKSDRVHGSIATIVKGNVATTSRISTALHIFINVLSTTLLTSSNYAMQLLCAPTPEEISRAHQTGKWLEIGLMSFRNLRQIEKKRALLWWLLALSSAPLHLL